MDSINRSAEENGRSARRAAKRKEIGDFDNERNMLDGVELESKRMCVEGAPSGEMSCTPGEYGYVE